MAFFIHCIILLAATLFSTVFSLSHAAAIHARRADSVTANTFLTAHNDVRASYNVQPLTWSQDLASKAQEWANGCKLKNTDGSLSSEPYGENIAAGVGQFSIGALLALFTADYASFHANHSYTHFTQVVWKSTTQLGCAVTQCDGIFEPSYGKAAYYVCLYDPPGNVMGQLLDNVPSSI